MHRRARAGAEQAFAAPPPAACRARLRDIQGSRAELCDMGLPGAVYAQWDIGREWVEETRGADEGCEMG